MNRIAQTKGNGQYIDNFKFENECKNEKELHGQITDRTLMNRLLSTTHTEKKNIRTHGTNDRTK